MSKGSNAVTRAATPWLCTRTAARKPHQRVIPTDADAGPPRRQPLLFHGFIALAFGKHPNGYVNLILFLCLAFPLAHQEKEGENRNLPLNENTCADILNFIT